MTTPIAAGLVDADVRARFERWITAPPFEKTIERHGENGSWPGNYRDYGVQLAWCAWEDSAKAELDACRATVRGVMVTDNALNTWNRCMLALEKRSNAGSNGPSGVAAKVRVD